MVMSSGPDPAHASEHHRLTRRFVGAITGLIIGAIVTLGLIAVRYAATSSTEQAVLLVVLFVCLVATLASAGFAVRFARGISKLSKS